METSEPGEQGILELTPFSSLLALTLLEYS